MVKIRYIVIVILIGLPTQLNAQFLDSISLGVAAGFNNNKTIESELYLKKNFWLFDMVTESKIGVNRRTYQLDFDSIQNLDASSIGLFADVAVYPFNPSFFIGVRWEAINFNWLSDESMQKIEALKNYSATSMYTGTCIFLQLGYNLQLSEKVGIKLFGQPGFHQFKISNGANSSGGFVQGSPNNNAIIEDHRDFMYNIMLGIEYRMS